MTTTALRPKPLVGQNVPCTDGAAKVKGSALYIDDLPRLEGEPFGATSEAPSCAGSSAA